MSTILWKLSTPSKGSRPPLVAFLSHVKTSIASTIIFSDTLFLTDVFFIPTFKLNLISISKLVRNLSCRIIIDEYDCLIQDKATKKMISAADVEGDLYTLNIHEQHAEYKNFANNFTKVDENAWHLRFGHTSHEKFKVLRKKYDCIESPSRFC